MMFKILTKVKNKNKTKSFFKTSQQALNLDLKIIK